MRILEMGEAATPSYQAFSWGMGVATNRIPYSGSAWLKRRNNTEAGWRSLGIRYTFLSTFVYFKMFPIEDPRSEGTRREPVNYKVLYNCWNGISAGHLNKKLDCNLGPKRNSLKILEEMDGMADFLRKDYKK